MLKQISLSIVILLLGFLGVNAQQLWTLNQCVDYALEHNIQIKQQELSTKITENELTTSRAAVLPNLYAGTNYQYVTGRSVDGFTNEIVEANSKSNNLYLQSSVTLFSGMQQYNTVKQNQFKLQAALQDVEVAKNSIVINVATTYLDILFAEELLKVSKAQFDITKQQADRVQKLVESGSSAKGAFLEIQAQLAQEELEIINAENKLKISYLNLTQLLELDSVGDFKIVIPEIQISAENVIIDPVEAIYNDAIAYLPEIKSADYELKASEKSLLVAKGRYSPSLTASASYNTGYSDQRFLYNEDKTTRTYPYGDQLKDNASKSISLTLSIPIFTRLQTRTAVSNAHIYTDLAHKKLILEKNQIHKNIQQAHANAISAMKRYNASSKAVVSTREAFNYAQEKYNVGLLNAVEYQTTKNKLSQIESDLVQAKYEFFFRKTILDYYRGKPIKFD